MDPTDIPNGEWLCYACRCASKRELLDNKGNDKKKKKSALEVLALAASLINPREFELPKELQLPIMFPGSNKVDYVSGRRGKQLSSSYNNGKRVECDCDAYIFFCLHLPRLSMCFSKASISGNVNYDLSSSQSQTLMCRKLFFQLERVTAWIAI